MKKIRIPVRLMQKVWTEQTFWVPSSQLKLVSGDVVGLQHPAAFDDGSCYAYVRVRYVEHPVIGFTRISFEECQG